jgi:ABC-type sulfate transport system permease subunit
VLCVARAVSEFGATLMFAGNFTGRTQTMSLAIMTALETDLPCPRGFAGHDGRSNSHLFLSASLSVVRLVEQKQPSPKLPLPQRGVNSTLLR